jgi:hypothetical protein
MRSLSGHIQQRQEELRELARPVIAERLELLVEQLWEDPGLWEEINDRYERGSLRGNYPALLKDLSEVKELRASGNRRVAYVSRNDGKAVESF